MSEPLKPDTVEKLGAKRTAIITARVLGKGALAVFGGATIFAALVALSATAFHVGDELIGFTGAGSIVLMGGPLLYVVFIVVRGAIRDEHHAIAQKKADAQSAVQRQQVVKVLAEIEAKLPDEEKAADAALVFANISSKEKGDAIEKRSADYQRQAKMALVLSSVGPLVAAAVVLEELNPSYLFASVALAGVPLTVGAMLLRHDGKLRTHLRELEREVARLERVKLAVGFARAVTSKRFQEQVKKDAVRTILYMGPVPMEHDVEEPEPGLGDVAGKAMTVLGKPGDGA